MQEGYVWAVDFNFMLRSISLLYDNGAGLILLMNTFKYVAISGDEESHQDAHASLTSMDGSKYNDFKQLLITANLWNKFQSDKTFECGLCKSFTVNRSTLFHIVDTIIGLIDLDEVDLGSDLVMSVYDQMCDMRNGVALLNNMKGVG